MMYRKFKDTLNIMPAFYDYLSVYVLDDLWVDAHALPALKTMNFAEKPLRVEGDDYAGDMSTTGVIVIDGAAVNGVINHAGDKDWFRFVVAQDQVVLFAPTENYASDYVRLRVYDAEGNLEAYAATSNSVSEHLFQEAGTYFIEVLSDSQSTDISYSVQLSSIADDYANNISTTARIGIGETVDGFIQYYSDSDWFRFSGTMGQVIDFSLMTSGLGNVTTLFITDSDGFQIQGGSYGQEQLAFVVPENGVYYVAIRSGPNVAQGTGTFSITASEIFDDYANDLTTSASLPVGGVSITGQLDYNGDEDFFAIVVEAGQEINFLLTALQRNFSSLSIFIYSSTGDYLISDSQIDEVGLAYDFTASGTYYVKVATLDHYLHVAEYVLGAYLTGADDYTADVFTVGALQGGVGSASGIIQYIGDEDWFSVNLEQGKYFSVEVETSLDSSGLRKQVLFSIVDSAGNTLLDEAASVDNKFGFFAENDGEYFVVISAYDPDAQHMRYTLNTENYDDDYAATVTTSGILQFTSPTVGSLDYAGDADWFAVDMRGVEMLQLNVEWQSGYSDESLSLYIRLEDGSRLPLGITGGDGAHLEFNIPEDYQNQDVFYIEIVTENSVGTGAYTLTAEAIFDYVGDSTDDAMPLAVGDTFSETLLLGDLDVYAIQVPLDGSVLIELSGPGSMITPGSSRFSGFNFFMESGIFSMSDGVQNISLTRSSNGTVFLIFEEETYMQIDPDSDGLIYLLVGGPYYAVSQGEYTVSVSAFVDDHGGTVNTATEIALGEYQSGFIDANRDYDMFSVHLTEGQIVRFSVEAHTNGHGGEYRVSYMSPTDTVSGSDHVNIQGSMVDYGVEASYTGLHYFRVTNINGTTGSHYEVLIEEAEFVVAPMYIFSLGDVFEGHAPFAAAPIDSNFPVVAQHILRETSIDTFAVIIRSVAEDPYYRDPDIEIGGGLATYSSYAFFDRQIAVLDAGSYNLSLSGSGGVFDYFISLVEYLGGTDEPLNIIGSDADSIIDGFNDDDVLDGAGGDDYIYAAGGDDVLLGGAGDDVLDGGRGADVLNGGSGSDTAHYQFEGFMGNNGIVVNLDDPSQNTYAAIGDTYISIENVFGTQNSGDILTGDGGNNIINGGRGADTLYGLAGDDHLIADRGVLFGGAGDDILETAFGGSLYGGAGDDVLISALFDASIIDGGSGIDVAVYGERSADFIRVVANIDGTYSVFRGRNFTREEVISNVEIIRVGGVDYDIDSLAEPEILQHDDFYGVAGVDRFMIFADSVDDRIFGFEDGIDRIAFSGDMYRYSQLKIYQDGADVIIASSNGVTRLVDTNIADIDASDFIFRIGADDGDMENIDTESAENMPDAEIVLYDEFGVPDETYEAFRLAIADMRSPEDVFYEYNEHGILEIITPDDAIL